MRWQVDDLVHIMAFLVHSLSQVLHSVEQGTQGLLAGQGLSESPKQGCPLPSNKRGLILKYRMGRCADLAITNGSSSSWGNFFGACQSQI